MAVVNRPKEPTMATTSEPTPTDRTAVMDQPATADTNAAPADTTAAETAPAAGAPGARARAAAAGANTAVMLARLIRTVAGIVALLIALGIAFVVLKASPSNTIVSHIHDWAKWLVGPFDGMFHLHSARGTIALNWGIALVVYLLIGSLLARIVATPARTLRRRTVPA
jgi:hypothetical protein